MRWDNLTLSDESAQDTLFGVSDVITRTFDTPEFRGMTFYEVRARSILNKVPAASRPPPGCPSAGHSTRTGAAAMRVFIVSLGGRTSTSILTPGPTSTRRSW